MIENKDVIMIKKIIAIFLLMVFCITLISCGSNPKGIEYAGKRDSENYIECEFKGNKISINVYVLGDKKDSESISGKYEIDDGQITISYKNSKGDNVVTTRSFETIDKNSFKMDAFIFEKDK